MEYWLIPEDFVVLGIMASVLFLTSMYAGVWTWALFVATIDVDAGLLLP